MQRYKKLFTYRDVMLENKIPMVGIFMVTIMIFMMSIIANIYGSEWLFLPAPTAPTTLEFSVVGAVGAGSFIFSYLYYARVYV